MHIFNAYLILKNEMKLIRTTEITSILDDI